MATDTFTRANETPVAAPWTELSGSTGDVNLSSNALTKSSNGDYFIYYAGAASTNDQYAEFQINTVPNNNDWGPAVQVGANGFSGIWASAFPSGSSKELNKFVAGSFSTVASSTVANPVAGDVLRIEIEGTTVRWILNGTTRFSGTDSSLSGGDVGAFWFGTGGALDNFDGGDIGGSTAYTLDAQPGSFAITGAAAGTTRAVRFNAGPGSYAVTGAPAGLVRGFNLNAQPGSLAVSGADLGATKAVSVDAQPGSYAVTGAAAGLGRGISFNAEPGSYAITGVDAQFPLNRVLAALAGSYAVTGSDIGMAVARVLSADPGVFTITGIDAELLYTANGSTAYELNAEPGSFSITGADAGLPRSLVIALEPGEYVVTGADSGLPVGRVLSIEPGTFVVTGDDAGLAREIVLNAEPGAFVVDGAVAGLVPPESGAVITDGRRVIHIRFGIYP